MIVLDTNVVSELMRPVPSPLVTTWVRGLAPKEVATTSITVAEIGYGIARLPPGAHQDRLLVSAQQVFSAFPEQVLPFDHAAALEYGELVVTREGAGRPVSGFDAQIAAICRAHGAQLATRNTKDFVGTEIGLVDPWQVR
ncbi:MAG TPA: type II toxin-antitoxin system VapC family toxin [Mycobacteriales bacterium]|jgi:hypothetical protein|nr:type II toxin-antitoxin system VapC family toxin [Mycobacteriales bacterium]